MPDRECSPPPGFKGINVVNDAPVGGVPEPGGLPQNAALSPDEVPKPPVKSQCKVCALTYLGYTRWAGVVSPSGVEHIGVDGGDTACGKDATGPNWWWPL